MTNSLKAFRRLPRGRHAARVLGRFGIEPLRYWLLIDLFALLSERGEMMDQLGTHGVALKGAAWMYAAFSALLTLILVMIGPPIRAYLALFMSFTAFILFAVLLAETGNSLVNPAEGVVLAHQPVNGATYTAAKLTHLARIVLILVPGLNLVPAVGGVALRNAEWWYPLAHIAIALGIGIVAALLSCALYGWLIRLVPVQRLKAIGQIAGVIPFLGVMAVKPVGKWLAHSRLVELIPADPAARWALGLLFGTAALVAVALGIRSLSADYLIRVSGMMHAGSVSRTRSLGAGRLVARLFGGQPGRAGFTFVSRLARRDFQVVRQLLMSASFILMGLAPMLVRDWHSDPFQHSFTAVHLIPHACGVMLYSACRLLPYGSDFKAAWAFLLAPAHAFHGFARGVYAALLLHFVAVPHAFLFALLAWPWGVWKAALFVCYSTAVALVYLALTLRLIDGVPFTQQPNASARANELPLAILGAFVIAVAVAIQFFLVFRSLTLVAATTVIAGAVAYRLARRSLGTLETSMRYRLGLLTAESGPLYVEVEG